MGRLTCKEIDFISSKLNEKVDLPLLGEKTEQIILEKAVKLIDDALYNILPDEIYDLVHMSSDGITAEEAQIIKKRLSDIINKHVNIIFLSEDQEKKIIDKFLDIIALAIQKGKDILSS